jgi:hypothetical protein
VSSFCSCPPFSSISVSSSPFSSSSSSSSSLASCNAPSFPSSSPSSCAWSVPSLLPYTTFISAPPTAPPAHLFTIASWNANSLKNPNKHNDLSLFLHYTSPSILSIQEPWLDNIPPPIFPNYNNLYIPHPSSPTGLLFYFHSSVMFKQLDILVSPYNHTTNTMSAWFHICSPLLSSPIILCGCYLSPQMYRYPLDWSNFLGSINAAITFNLPVFIIGDFNSRHVAWDTTTNSLGKMMHNSILAADPPQLDSAFTLLNTLHNNPPLPPTRPISNSIIDLCISTHPQLVNSFKVLSNSYLLSDHDAIMVTFLSPHSSSLFSSRVVAPHTKWDTKRADWDLFQTCLIDHLSEWYNTYQIYLHVSPSNLSESESVCFINKCWQQLLSIIMRAAKLCVGKVTIKHSSKKWFTVNPAIPTLYQQFRKLYRAVTRHKLHGTLTSDLLNAYTSAKRNYNQATYYAKQLCWAQLASTIDRKHKVVWSAWRRTIPSCTPPLPSFSSPSLPYPTTPYQSLNNLADHLANVSSLPSDPAFDNSMNSTVDSLLSSVHRPSLCVELPFSYDSLVSACIHVRHNSASGPDDISCSFVKYGGDGLYKALYLFFSLCYNHCVLPSSFTNANVVPIYKQTGDVNDPNNYRPISLTSIIIRVYESLLLPSLHSYMKASGIPSLEQFGFTRDRSTYDAIYRLQTSIDQVVHNNSILHHSSTYLPVVFIDIAKAYDRVWIDGLLYKLYNVGVRNHLFYFYKSLLYNRSLQVVHSNISSSTRLTSAGVPQGSVSGPDLFTIYIHDIIHNTTICSNINKFADDMCLWPKIPGPLAHSHLQHSLNSMSAYASKWKIKFSNSKTQCVIFYNNRRSKIKPSLPPLSLSNFNIQYVDSYKYLGVIFDSKLNFYLHCKYVYDKSHIFSNYICHLVSSKCRPSFPVVNKLVQSILIPKITYGFPFIIINCAFMRKFKQLVIEPLRRSLGLPYTSHHASIFIESRILPIDYLQTYHTISFVHRLLSIPVSSNNYASILFKPIWHQYSNTPIFHKSSLFYRFQSAFRRVPCFSSISSLLSVQRCDIRTHVYNQFYNIWYNMNDRHSLHPYYTSSIPPSIHTFPSYFYYDNPFISAFRSRLRFNRARLNASLFRRACVPSPNCPYCLNSPQVETVEHVICVCIKYDMLRQQCTRQLASYGIPFSFNNILCSPPDNKPNIYTPFYSLYNFFVYLWCS